MAEPKKSNNNLVAIVAAITALVTSITSLVKALDKTIEQTSYETLSHKIVELQEGQHALQKQVAALASAQPSLPPSVPSAAAPSAVASPGLPTRFPGAPPLPFAHPPQWKDLHKLTID